MIINEKDGRVKLARKITIDRQAKRVLIDGEQFEYHLAVEGPDVDNAMSSVDLPIVYLPVLAEDVEIIPKDES